MHIWRATAPKGPFVDPNNVEQHEVFFSKLEDAKRFVEKQVGTIDKETRRVFLSFGVKFHNHWRQVKHGEFRYENWTVKAVSVR